MTVELRLCDEDHQQYAAEGAPEWVAFDRDALSEIPFDEQYPWEREIQQTNPDTSIALLCAWEFPRFSGIGIKGMIWLAWKMAGLETPPWADFNIKTLKAKTRTVRPKRRTSRTKAGGEDAVPPADGSTEPSSEKTES